MSRLKDLGAVEVCCGVCGAHAPLYKHQTAEDNDLLCARCFLFVFLEDED